MLLGGLIALAAMILQSFSAPKSNLERFAQGGLVKLAVLGPAPQTPQRKFSGPNSENGAADMSLADFRGKTILVNVWATWCAPCIAEIPSLDQLQADYGGDGFEVVTISLDRDRVEAESFFASNAIKNLAVYHDASLGMASDFGVPGLPITAAFNPAGQELFRIPGEVNWQSAEADRLIREILP